MLVQYLDTLVIDQNTIICYVDKFITTVNGMETNNDKYYFYDNQK